MSNREEWNYWYARGQEDGDRFLCWLQAAWRDTEARMNKWVGGLISRNSRA